MVPHPDMGMMLAATKLRNGMRLCYLINQYPKVSHSFIRREILELERLGAQVQRIALRGWEQILVDAGDVAEQGRTRYVLKAGLPGILAALAGQLLRQPLRFSQGLWQVLVMYRGSDRALLKHLICFAEGCVVAQWVRKAEARHIHAHFGTNSAEVALFASLLGGVPYSFTVHGPEEFDHPAGLRLPEKIRRAALVVAVSSYGRSQLYRWAQYADWPRIHVIHCGLDASFIDALPTATQQSQRLVCVGRLSEQKGQLLLLEALRQVLDRGCRCHLVLAGDGEMRDVIEARVEELRLQNDVSITGWLDSGQIRQQILSARALVLPSFAEGLPVVLMESLALHRPVIATSVAGIPELVSPDHGGWLMPAGDPEALAGAMIDCLQAGHDRLSTVAAAGRQRVLQNHDIRTECARLLAHFGDCGS